MRSGWIRNALLYLVIAGVGIGGGLFAGGKYSQLRSEAEAASQNVELQSFLESHIQGIKVGGQFPEIPLWTRDGQYAADISTILPEGGLIFYIASECGSCYATIQSLEKALGVSESPKPPVILVVKGDPSPVARFMADNNFKTPLYQDAEERLAKENGVSAFPAYFSLDRDLQVLSFGTTAKTVKQIQEVLAKVE